MKCIYFLHMLQTLVNLKHGKQDWEDFINLNIYLLSFLNISSIHSFLLQVSKGKSMTQIFVTDLSR